MNKYFRLCGLVLLLLCPRHALFAQYPDSAVVETHYDSVELNPALLLDSIFKPLNRSRISTGLLMDKSIALVDYAAYAGQLHDSNYADYGTLLRLYGALYRAALDTPLLPYVNEYKQQMQAAASDSVLPLGGLLMQYQRIKTHAFSDSLLKLGGIQFFDGSSTGESPYELGRVLVLAPLHSYTRLGQPLYFSLPGSCLLNNTGQAISQLQADWGLGQGWQALALNQPYAVNYPDTGTYTHTYRFILDGGDTLYSHSRFYVLPPAEAWVAAPGSGESWNIAPTAAHAGAWVSILYGCGHTRLMKPLIIAEGFDPAMPPYYNGLTFDGFRSKLREAGMLTPLLSAGYDLVYVDNKNGTDWLERNATLLQEVIQRVNSTKAANGGQHANVLLGESMGGLVARMALRNMELLGQAHDTRLYISLDAPQQGAYVPLGVQYMLKDMDDFNVGGWHMIRDEVPQLADAVALLQSPAARQMLLYQAYTSQSQWWSFYGALQHPAYGLPQGYSGRAIRNVAIANGSQIQAPQGSGLLPSGLIYPGYAPHYTMLKVQQKLLVPWWMIPVGMQYAGMGSLAFSLPKNHSFYADVNALPARYQGNHRIQKTKLTVKAAGLVPVKLIDFEHHLQGSEPYEVAPGGVYDINQFTGGQDIQSLLGSYASSLQLYTHSFCFIPSVSALNISFPENQSLFYNIKGSNILGNNKTAFKNYTAPDQAISANDNLFNELHTSITALNKLLLEEELLDYEEHSLGSSLAAGNSYNFGRNSSGGSGIRSTTDRLGSLNIQNGASLFINKTASIGYPAQGLPVADAASVFTVYSKSVQCGSVSGPVTINIQSGGELALGDAGSGSSGNLVLTYGTTLNLLPGSTLRLHHNSRLIIEPGADLYLSPGAAIQLQDDNSVLEIRGQLHLKADADFSFSGNGYVRLELEPEGGGDNVFVENDNCSLTFVGNDRNDKVLEIAGYLKLPGFNSSSQDALKRFKIYNAKVELGTNVRIEAGSKVDIQQVQFSRVNGAGQHGGLLLQGQAASDIYLRHCEFNDAYIGLWRVGTGSSTSIFEAGDCIFSNCNTGLLTNNEQSSLKYLKFVNCNTGWEAENMNQAAEYLGWALNCNKAIDYKGSANLFVYFSHFESNNTAISSEGAGTAAIKCSDFYGNSLDLAKSDGILNLSSSAAYTRLSSNTDYAGKNKFENSIVNCIQLDQADQLLLNDGSNSFVFNPNPSGRVITGTLNSSAGTLNLGGNYWQMQQGGTVNFLSPSYFDLFNASNAPMTFSGSNLGSSSIDCARWNGEPVSDANWNVFLKRPVSLDGAVAAENTYTLWPNPASGHIQLKVPGVNKGDYTVLLTDVLGRTFSIPFRTQSSGLLNCEVGELAEGFYYLELAENGMRVFGNKVLIKH